MNLEKELRLQMDIYESGVQAEIVREDGRIKMRPVPTPGLPVREPMRQAEPQDKGVAGALADIPVAAAGITKGAVEATAGLPGDIYALGKGLYSAAFPEEGETRSEAFGRAIDEASKKFGAEAVRSIIDPVLLPMARKAGMSEEDIQLLQEGADVGQFAEVPGVGLAVRAGVKAAPGMARKAGDVVEGMGEAAKARMGEGGVELGSGVNPDPAIAAAGDAVAKFRAPKENEPGIIAFHGSGADFDEFKLEKIGTGEGAQAYGYGLYFADKEDIAKYYKSMMQRSVDIDGRPYIRGNQMNSNLVDEDIADDLGATNGDLEAAIKNSEEFLQEMISADNVEAIRSTSRELEKLKALRGRVTVNNQKGRMYKVGLEPKPEDMLDYQIPIEQQPKNIQQKVKKALSYIYPDVKDPALSMRGSDFQNAIINRVAVSKGNIEKMSDPIDADINRIDPNNEKTEAAIATQIMLEQGIPGMKYRDAGSRGGSKSLKDASFNYVIFDDKMIKILEKYGIAGPVAITSIAASQEEGKGDGKAA